MCLIERNINRKVLPNFFLENEVLCVITDFFFYGSICLLLHASVVKVWEGSITLTLWQVFFNTWNLPREWETVFRNSFSFHNFFFFFIESSLGKRLEALSEVHHILALSQKHVFLYFCGRSTVVNNSWHVFYFPYYGITVRKQICAISERSIC